MAVPIKYIGQAAMDEFYQNFRGNADFFDIDDFIFRAGSIITDYYQKLYLTKYNELRSEKINKAQLIGFDSDLLSVQELEVKTDKETREIYAELKYPVMAFMYDESNTGYQLILSVKPRDVNIERTSLGELWQVQYYPFTNRVFWLVENGRIIFIKKGFCNVNKVKLYYIPSLMDEGVVNEDTPIADGLVEMAITATVLKMKQEKEGTVVKETNDMNPNKTIESEINKTALK